MAEWIHQYRDSFIQPDKLQEIVDLFMTDYDKRKEEVRTRQLFLQTFAVKPCGCNLLGMFFFSPQEAERVRMEAEQQEEDEEGWVKVTRGHKGAKARPHSEAANQRTLQKELRKKKRKELLNFYTWQHRNTQKERECPNGAICSLESFSNGFSFPLFF